MSRKGAGSSSRSYMVANKVSNSSLRGAAAAASGPSPRTVDNSRESHIKLQTDVKYNMLLWQSKLQEKLLQDQKEKKQKEQIRRKSDEEYHLKPPSRYTRPLRGGGSGGHYITIGANNDAINSTRKFVVETSNGHDEIRKEDFNLQTTPTPTPIPTPFRNASQINNAQKDFQSENFLGERGAEKHLGSPNPNRFSDNNVPLGAATPDVISPQNFQSTGANAKQKQTFYSPYHNYNSSTTPTTENIPRTISTSTTNELGSKAMTILPKIENPNPLPKLVNSTSLDNIQKHAPFHSTNMAFFHGLLGFGSNNGAGAPRRSPSGRLLANLQGHPEIRYHQKDTRGFDQTLRYMMDRERILKYKEDLDKQILEKRNRNRSNNSTGAIKIMSSHESNKDFDLGSGSRGRLGSGENGKSGGVELVPLIRKYKSLPKLLNALTSTDVTKSYVQSPRRGDYGLSPEPQEIAKGLSIQLEEKQRTAKDYVEDEKKAAEKHFSTWDSFWGRPGCGAPMFYSSGTLGASTPCLATSRSDLFQALHMTHKNKPRN